MSSALYFQPTIVFFYLSLCPGEVCDYIRRPIIDIKKFWPKMDICLEGVNDTCL